MSDPQQTGTDLREFLTILRNRKWSIGLLTLLVVGAAIFFTFRETPEYTSETRVLVLPTAPANSPFFFLATTNLDTEAGLVSSDSVASIVRDDLDLQRSTGDLLGGLHVSVESSTEILDIAYTDPDPLTAQKLAQGFADAYLQFRREQTLAQIRGQTSAVQTEIDQVSEKITKLDKAINAETDPIRKSQLMTQQTTLTARLNVLQQKLEDLGSGSATSIQSGGAVIQAANLPAAPSNAGLTQNGLVALTLGLALGIGIAFVRERLDDSLRSRDDLEAHLGSPVFAVVPKVPTWRNRKRTRLTTLREPRGGASEAYRTLRTSILFLASQRQLKVLMVSSPAAGEGKTTTAANVAVVLAQAGKRVVLVSADLRKPRIHQFFGIEEGGGLVQVLSGEIPLSEALVETQVEGLSLVACGAPPAHPAELLQSDAMKRVLDELKLRYDFVVIDSAPALAVADSLVLAPIVDGVLFVADAARTSRQAVARARNQLEQVGGDVVGGVFNNFDPSKTHGGRYYYRYYYDRYGYQQAPYGGPQPPPPQAGNGRPVVPERTNPTI